MTLRRPRALMKVVETQFQIYGASRAPDEKMSLGLVIVESVMVKTELPPTQTNTHFLWFSPMPH
jgi:hypothetical protein